MNKAYLLLGSNIGDSEQQLTIAIGHLENSVGKVLRRSSIYSTAAWGNRDQPDFLNQVIIINTELSAIETINSILQIEKNMGRIRTTKNAPRVIDIDILYFNKQVYKSDLLTIPHPEIQNRRFVLVPLNELSPALKHPVLHKTTRQLLAECPDELDVKKF